MSEKTFLEFYQIQKNTYVKWDSVSKMIELCIEQIGKTENLTDDEKLKWVCGIEYLEQNLNTEAGKFVVEVELDELGIGDGKTKQVILKKSV